MQKWEYRVVIWSTVNYQGSAEACLNAMGQEGWELVLAVDNHLVFKRMTGGSLDVEAFAELVAQKVLTIPLCSLEKGPP